MNTLPRMDQYWKEVLQVSYKKLYKSSVYLCNKRNKEREKIKKLNWKQHKKQVMSEICIELTTKKNEWEKGK